MNWKFRGRRVFLQGLIGLAGVGAFSLISKFTHANNQTQGLLLDDDTPLRDRAAAKGLIYGASTEVSNLKVWL